MPKAKAKYVIARTPSGRISVQHKMSSRAWIGITDCGYDISNWSVAYMNERIDPIACRKPGCKEHDV